MADRPVGVTDGRTEGLTGRGRLLARLLGGPCTDLNKFICINGHSLHWLSHRAKQSPSAIRPPLFPSLSLPSLSPHHSLSLSFTACLLIESALEPLNCWQPATSNEPFTSSQLEQVLLLCRTRLSSRLACQCVNLLPLSHSACLSPSLFIVHAMHIRVCTRAPITDNCTQQLNEPRGAVSRQ